LFCPLHAALEYLNTLDTPASEDEGSSDGDDESEGWAQEDEAEAEAGNSGGSGGGPEVTVFLNRGTFQVAHALPVIARSVTIVGADADGVVSTASSSSKGKGQQEKQQQQQQQEPKPMRSLHCIGEPPANMVTTTRRDD
jgi:hypothetical protein